VAADYQEKIATVDHARSDMLDFFIDGQQGNADLLSSGINS